MKVCNDCPHAGDMEMCDECCCKECEKSTCKGCERAG